MHGQCMLSKYMYFGQNTDIHIHKHKHELHIRTHCKQKSACTAAILVVTVVTGTVTEPRHQELVTPRVRFSLSPTGRPYFRDLGR